MAKKKEETTSLIDTFSEFKDTKNIDRTTMVSVLEESFRSVMRSTATAKWWPTAK